MVVRMRVNRSKTGRRRSHHALAAKRAATCECGSLRAPHRVCPGCGKYNGKVIIDMVAATKRTQRRTAKKTKELRASGQAVEKDTTATK